MNVCRMVFGGTQRVNFRSRRNLLDLRVFEGGRCVEEIRKLEEGDETKYRTYCGATSIRGRRILQRDNNEKQAICRSLPSLDR